MTTQNQTDRTERKREKKKRKTEVPTDAPPCMWEHPDELWAGPAVTPPEPAATNGVADSVKARSDIATAGAATESVAADITTRVAAGTAMTARPAAGDGPAAISESPDQTAELRNGDAVAAATDTMPTWAAHLELVDVHDLVDHPMWHEILGPESPEREEALIDDLREGDLTPPIVLATGAECHSAPNTLLDGHRYVHAAQVIAPTKGRKVLVARRTNLSADAEQIVLIRSALRGQHARRLRPSQLAVLLDRLYALYARGKGFRSDLDDPTCVATNASAENGDGGRRPDTLSQVALAARQPRNAVANLRKVFGSRISHLSLHDAVDAEALPLTIGADIIRSVESEPEVAAVMKQAAEEKWEEDTIAANATIQEARAKVESRVREQLHEPARKQHSPPANDNNEAMSTVEAPGRMGGDALVLDCIFRARRTRVTVMATVIRLEDLGRDGRKTKAESQG
jgi:hypothetical protein